jgi:xanthine dehydrogenase accessory factor
LKSKQASKDLFMPLNHLRILIRGAGEMASASAVLLVRSGFRVVMTETAAPRSVRRGVSFCEAVYEGRQRVEGIEMVLAPSPDQANDLWNQGRPALLVDPDLASLAVFRPDVLVDAAMAKRNLGTTITLAPLVVALGPGFSAGRDCHRVVETNRGHNLGRLIDQGEAQANTREPGVIAGESLRRVLRAPAHGILRTEAVIGQSVAAGQIVADVEGQPIHTELSGVLRGLVRPGTLVHPGYKVGDVDPRGVREYCFTISDKARTVAGAVLEAILERFNR